MIDGREAHAVSETMFELVFKTMALQDLSCRTVNLSSPNSRLDDFQCRRTRFKNRLQHMDPAWIRRPRQNVRGVDEM